MTLPRVPALTLRHRRVIVVGIHLVLTVVSNYVAFLLRFDGAIPPAHLESCLTMLPWLVVIRGLVFIPFRLYEGLWRYTSIWDLRNIVGAVLVSTGAFAALTHWGFGLTSYPRSVFVIDSLVAVVLMGGIRLFRRVVRDFGPLERRRRVLVYGAGDAGEMIVRDMLHNPFYERAPVGFIDDDPGKRGRRIHGLRVLGSRADLAGIIAREAPEAVLIAMPRIGAATVREIVRALTPFDVEIETLPSLPDILGKKVEVSQIRSLSIEDLMERRPVTLSLDRVRRLVAGCRVMVTGAGGSIGAELCRQIAALDPLVLILYERYENGLYAVESELAARHPHLTTRAVVGDVTDAAHVNAAVGEHRPQIIFHAAAHKHVPLMELNPCEAVKNNILGTHVSIEAAAKHGVERFILISTDKAVNPSGVMGATKRVAELLVQSRNGRGPCGFAAVRFGNVLGSSGSAVPLFLDQIRAGGPVTVTHPEVRRYFMLTSEAVQLVLHAAATAQGGETFVLEMGEPIKVVDLARNLIRLAGFVPDRDIPITFVGLRPGEKLSEELVGGDETVEASEVPEIKCVRPRWHVDAARLAQQIAEIEERAASRDAIGVIKQLAAMVPTARLSDPALGPGVPGRRPAP